MTNSINKHNPFHLLSSRADEFGGVGFYHDYPFSNDVQTLHTFTGLSDGAADGVMLVVGSIGATLSFATRRPERLGLSVDRNPSVTKLSNHILRLISETDDGSKIVDAVDASLPTVFDQRGKLGLGLRVEIMRREFSQEIKNYGESHWTHPWNYPHVRERVLNGDITVVTADIANKPFQAALGEIARASGLDCTFLSMTNTHAYFRGIGKLRSVLAGLPLADNASIVYSDKRGEKSYTLVIAPNIEQYVSSVAASVGYELDWV